MAKHTLADRGHSSPFSCQDCSIIFRACGKVFWRAEVFLLVCYWGATGQPISALRTSMAPSWVSWGSWVSWPRHWSREAARRLPGPRQVAIHSQPLPVDGPPARHFIFRRADQDTRDTQDTQDRADAWCEALPIHAPIASAKRYPWTGKSQVRSAFNAPSWVSWVSWVSWPRRWSREAAQRLPRPPASCHSFPAASSGRTARKECRFLWTGRPQGISFSSGRARTPKTGQAKCLRTWHARKH